MDNLFKIQAFEYLLFKLVEWHKGLNGGNENNDLSVLKSLKLLFFVSAVGTTKQSNDTLLDDVFDNYVAMPFGHVESDIYNAIKNDKLVLFKINNNRAILKGDIQNLDLLNDDVKNKIDNSIKTLKSINDKIILMNAFDLVELSHSYYSWKYYFAKAKKNFTLREFIPTEIIKAEEKIFYLN
jgi:uncharacterized phage-associated protein